MRPTAVLMRALSNHTSQMILLSISPRIVLFENFLDPQTCSALMNAASPRLSKSKVSAGE